MPFETVLIVDDDPLIHAVCKAFFQRRGALQVLGAMNGAEGLTALEETPQIDLIVCDLKMPDVDGVQFLRLLMERRYSQPIIIISGEDGSVVQAAYNLAKSHNLCILGRVRKPLDYAALEEALAEPVVAPQRSGTRKTTAVSEADLRSAMQLGEISAYMQPKIECATGRVVGAEALARWFHPECGLVMPDSFIPVAEKAGLIPDLTHYILRDAMATKQRCAERGHNLKIAVNTDALTINQLDFPEAIYALTQAAGVPNEDVVLEVTERSLLQDGAASMEVMARLRMMRFEISIDDFGTGNSNMKQLCTFPFTELKIDRGFLEGVTNDSAKAICLNAIVSLAKSLQLTTVAEGIESEHDLALVQQAGVTYAQGYHIAKPMAPNDLVDWLEARRPQIRRKNLA